MLNINYKNERGYYLWQKYLALTTVTKERDLPADAVANEAKERNVSKIVVGLPKNMDGSEGWRAETIRSFVSILSEKTECEIILYDERLSTMQAHRMLSITDIKSKKRKQVIDTLSAQIILQNYLDSGFLPQFCP